MSEDHDGAVGPGQDRAIRAEAAATRRALLLKVLATVAVLGGVVAFLVVSSIDAGTAFYVHVDELMKDPAKWQGKELQVHGRVAPGSIHATLDGTTTDRIFVEQWLGATVTVHFRGVVPDTFKDNAEVVSKGRMKPDGTFEAEDITAKCPSKYQGAGST